MNRTKFYNTTIVNSIKEVDFLDNALSLFEINHTPSYYRMKGEDLGQPDLLSYKLYGTEQYWWIVCLVNDIQNPFSDFEEGQILKIPSILDIHDFYQRYSVR